MMTAGPHFFQRTFYICMLPREIRKNSRNRHETNKGDAEFSSLFVSTACAAVLLRSCTILLRFFLYY